MDLANQSDDDTVVMEDAPSVPGLRFRRLRAGSDYPDVARVWSSSYAADGIDIVWTSEDASIEFSEHGDFDQRRDVVIAEIDGAIIGGALLWAEERALGARTYNSHVSLIPEWRGRGIREALLRFCEGRLIEISKGHGPRGQKHFEVSARQKDNDWRRVVEQAGYVPTRYNIEMGRSLDIEVPEAAMPPGTELRPVRPEHWPVLWQESSEAFKDERNWSKQRFGEEAFNRWVGSRNWQPELWISAWSGDKMIGGTMNMIDSEENKSMSRNWGWIIMLFVRRDWRSKGLGRSLVVQSLRILKSKGVDSVALVVDTENPSGALGMYKDLGFVEIDRYMICQKPVP